MTVRPGPQRSRAIANHMVLRCSTGKGACLCRVSGAAHRQKIRSGNHRPRPPPLARDRSRNSRQPHVKPAVSGRRSRGLRLGGDSRCRTPPQDNRFGISSVLRPACALATWRSPRSPAPRYPFATFGSRERSQRHDRIRVSRPRHSGDRFGDGAGHCQADIAMWPVCPVPVVSDGQSAPTAWLFWSPSGTRSMTCRTRARIPAEVGSCSAGWNPEAPGASRGRFVAVP